MSKKEEELLMRLSSDDSDKPITIKEMINLIRRGLINDNIRFRDKIAALEFYCKYLKEDKPVDDMTYNGWVVVTDTKEEE